ncbi:hypothetical protein KSP24_06580 [Paenibacillus sp. AK121]|uniref:hypothetical protein n=1 Tax=Paenibacillus TaxID=44249 RepID=UPI001C229B01|nr:hypothetical protein [Paenibacillus sp. AK121]MBU9706593.1 hypothetical protein [Paenibacillus sp. AK121]MEE4566781.1 hypothetical protein [Paenibacillus polymyxa]
MEGLAWKQQLVAVALGGALVIGAFVYSSYAAESEAPSQISAKAKAEDIHILNLVQGDSHKQQRLKSTA